MNQILRTGLLAASLLLPARAWAQQSFFNVPSSDITPQRNILFQQQVDLHAEEIRGTTTFTYGLGRGWEAGLNLYNVDYLPPERQWLRNDTTTQEPFAPLLLGNVQKIFELTETLHLGFGGQAGLNLLPTQKSRFVGFGYANLGGSFADEHYKTVVGVYTGNPRYLGDGPTAGFHAGFDAGIFYQKFHLLGDWSSGMNETGQLVIGGEVYLTEHLPLAVGWRRSNRDGQQAVVVQLTYTPK